MEMDVIYVAVQYRLGIFGFMSTWGGSVEENLLGGNYGLLDQQLAIRFLRDNAANLGGDPEKITIFGESAGGQSIGKVKILPHYEVICNYLMIQNPDQVSLKHEGLSREPFISLYKLFVMVLYLRVLFKTHNFFFTNCTQTFSSETKPF